MVNVQGHLYRNTPSVAGGCGPVPSPSWAPLSRGVVENREISLLYTHPAPPPHPPLCLVKTDVSLDTGGSAYPS